MQLPFTGSKILFCIDFPLGVNNGPHGARPREPLPGYGPDQASPCSGQDRPVVGLLYLAVWNGTYKIFEKLDWSRPIIPQIL